MLPPDEINPEMELGKTEMEATLKTWMEKVFKSYR